MTKKIQNEIAHNYLKGSDLNQREQEVLADASQKTGFTATQLMGRSSWWGSTEIGAFHYVGEYRGKKAVIKVQGVKPSISEIYMIESFAQTNKSKLIRPPHLYNSLPWDDEKRYEALILEFIEGQRMVSLPTDQGQVKGFFDIYKDYRANCLQSPWVDKPTETISEKIKNNFAKWWESSLKIYPNHPLRQEEDNQLVDEAVAVLEKLYQGVEPQFQHGHFSHMDLYEAGKEIVVLSNLFWSWKPPLYDTVFAYHWFMYNFNGVDGITPEEIEEQRKIWMDAIQSLPQTQGEGQRLLWMALLERATAGLVIDALSCDPKKPIATYLINQTRKIIRNLIEELT